MLKAKEFLEKKKSQEFDKAREARLNRTETTDDVGAVIFNVPCKICGAKVKETDMDAHLKAHEEEQRLEKGDLPPPKSYFTALISF